MSPKTKLNPELSMFLYELHKGLGISQNEISKMVNIPKSTISQHFQNCEYHGFYLFRRRGFEI